MAAGDPLRERHVGRSGLRRRPGHLRPRRLHRHPGGRQVAGQVQRPATRPPRPAAHRPHQHQGQGPPGAEGAPGVPRVPPGTPVPVEDSGRGDGLDRGGVPRD